MQQMPLLNEWWTHAYIALDVLVCSIAVNVNDLCRILYIFTNYAARLGLEPGPLDQSGDERSDHEITAPPHYK